MENIFQDSLDRAISDQKLEEIDIEYYYDAIDSQIDSLLSLPSKKNYLKKFEQKINDEELALDHAEKRYFLDEMYNTIITKISEKLGFSVDTDEVKINQLAKNLYKFFVLDYTTNLTYFLEMYIIENKNNLIKNLNNPIEKRIEALPNKISIIMNNISDIIELVASDNINFTEYVSYINKHEDSTSSADIMLEYDRDCLSDTDNTIQLILNELVDENDGFSKIYTDLQLRLFKKFASNDF